MRRWSAVSLGCVTALGMFALLQGAVARLELPAVPVGVYVGHFVAASLGGYVAGHFVPRWHAWYGALAAGGYIIVIATVAASREIALAYQSGPGALPPIDFLDLVLTDVAALTGAALGGGLAARLNGPGPPGSVG